MKCNCEWFDNNRIICFLLSLIIIVEVLIVQSLHIHLRMLLCTTFSIHSIHSVSISVGRNKSYFELLAVIKQLPSTLPVQCMSHLKSQRYVYRVDCIIAGRRLNCWRLKSWQFQTAVNWRFIHCSRALCHSFPLNCVFALRCERAVYECVYTRSACRSCAVVWPIHTRRLTLTRSHSPYLPLQTRSQCFDTMLLLLFIHGIAIAELALCVATLSIFVSPPFSSHYYYCCVLLTHSYYSRSAVSVAIVVALLRIDKYTKCSFISVCFVLFL